MNPAVFPKWTVAAAKNGRLHMVAQPVSRVSEVSETRERQRRTAGSIGRDDFDRNVWCVLGIPVDISTEASAVGEIEAAVRARRPLSFVTPNVNWLVRALKSGVARREILNADLSLADGAPLVLAARLLGTPQRARVAGSDIFEALRARPGVAGRRLRVFFFGGRDGAGEAACRALDAQRGGVAAAGWLNPGYGDVEDMSRDDIIEEINAAEPDFVVVALGAAKGQAWIERNRRRLSAPVIAHLGAVVDFTAGTVARAPAPIARAGLEWAWRIAAEPSLWRRYCSDALALVGIATRRFAPQVFAGRARHGAIPASVKLTSQGGGAVISLGGSLVSGDLDAVRKAFREAAAAPGSVTLDFAASSRMDRAFLGLVLMLEKHMAARGVALRATGLSRAQRALFKANAMHYSAPEGAVGEAAPASGAAAAI